MPGPGTRSVATHPATAAAGDPLRPKAETGDSPYRTESNLLHVLTDADVDLSTVFLSNAVLALAEDQTNNEDIFRRYPDYLRDYADWHRRWLEERRPRLVVLMGAEHLNLYRRATVKRFA